MLNKQICIKCRKEDNYEKTWTAMDDSMWEDEQILWCAYTGSFCDIYLKPNSSCPYFLEQLLTGNDTDARKVKNFAGN